MRWLGATSLLLSAAGLTGANQWQHGGRRDPLLASRMQGMESFHEPRYLAAKEVFERQTTAPKFANANTTKYAVNGTGIPDVDFDVGESYSGLMPIGGPNNDQELFFWFFPSDNPSANKEILIWLNGGPGCSSLEGLLQENGPFLWQYGTYKPVNNPWSWNRLTHVVWVEQPVGTGYSQGKPTATSEEDVAKQFMGFWKNFVDTFSLQGYKVYIAGESYAGQYCPYIASAMLDAKDTSYYNVSGVLIYDPVLGDDSLQSNIPTPAFVNYWTGLFPFNDTYRASINSLAQSCGFNDYLDKYLVYPPAGFQPSVIPGSDRKDRACYGLWNDVLNEMFAINPCFDVYQVATTCPLQWDVLGFPGSLEYLPEGASIYFNRPDVKAAIHAPLNTTWAICTDTDVFVNGSDSSPPSGRTVLPGVIERTNNVIIGHGALDMILLANGSLLQIQNMTWNGAQGFQSRPTEPFYVPWHDDPSLATIAGQGVLGTAHTERGLTYVGVDLSGHMVPQYAPSAAYRHLEFLLGRIGSLSEVSPFTTNQNYTQPVSDVKALGNGTAPQGWSNGGGNGSAIKDGSKNTTSAGTASVNLSRNGSGAIVALLSMAAATLLL